MQLTIFPEVYIQELYEPQPEEILISIREPLQRNLTPHGTFAQIYHLKIHDLSKTVTHPTFKPPCTSRITSPGILPIIFGGPIKALPHQNWMRITVAF